MYPQYAPLTAGSDEPSDVKHAPPEAVVILSDFVARLHGIRDDLTRAPSVLDRVSELLAGEDQLTSALGDCRSEIESLVDLFGDLMAEADDLLMMIEGVISDVGCAATRSWAFASRLLPCFGGAVMSTERLLRHFPMIARVLLTEYRDRLGEANITWLGHRLEHNDWESQDAVRLRESNANSGAVAVDRWR